MYLPNPPDDVEKYLYVYQDKKQLYVFGIISALLLIVGMVLFSISSPALNWYLIFAFMTALYLSLSYWVIVFGGSFDLKEHLFSTYTIPDVWPSVDVYLPSCGEDLKIIYNTLIHVSKMEYAGELKVYVLDDSKDFLHSAALKTNCAMLGLGYISRENKGELKKSGNVRHAFPLTSGEFILILDADFVPRKDFLLETIPLLVSDPKIGILQTPQFFNVPDNVSSIHKGAAYVQELFYRLIQVARNKWGASICVGTSAVYRRKALEPFGGTAPMQYSEDAFTGLQTISSGYKIKYVPINLSKGVCPDTISAYVTQLYRWATGSITMFGLKKFWFAPVSIQTKLCYLTGQLYFIMTGIGVLIGSLPSIIILVFFPEKIALFNAIYSIPSLIYGMILIPLWTTAPWGLYAIEARIISYYAHLLALIDKITSSTLPWVPTGAVGKKSSLYIRFKMFFFTWGMLTTVLPLGLSIYRMCTFGETYHFIPSLLLGFINITIFSIIGYRLIKE